MTSPTSRTGSSPASDARSSGTTEGSSGSSSGDATTEKTADEKATEQANAKLTRDEFSASLEGDNEAVISLGEAKDTKKKKRTVGGQKVEVTARESHIKKPVDVSPTEWATLTKVTGKAKEIFWPEKTWKKLVMYTAGLPISLPGAIATGIGLAAGHSAKTITHGVKHLKANISKDSKLPPFLHNINPFRDQDFVELTEDEKDKYAEQMDKSWENYQKQYNKGKDEDEQIKSEDVAKWGFDVPKKKGGRFGFRIVYRIPDRKGKYVKGQDKNRKYKVDKDGTFEYKMKYLFWGYLDEDLDSIFVECTNIVDNWDVIINGGDERIRIRASTRKELKEKIKNYKSSTKEAKSREAAKQNSGLHTTVQRTLHNKKIIDVLNNEMKLNRLHTEKISISTEEERKKLWALKEKTKNLIECIRKCANEPSDEQFIIIEEKYADKESYPEKIRKDFKIDSKSKNFDKAYKKLEKYLKMIGAIDDSQIYETTFKIENGTGMEEEIATITTQETKKIKDSFILLNTSDVKKEIDQYFSKTKDKSEASIYHSKIPANSITLKAQDIAKLENVPLSIKPPFSLQYDDDKKLVVDENGGDFEFNYATIYEESEGGHYFSIYKENGEYYIYNITKNLSDKEALKIDEAVVKKHLQNAKTIVYEQKSAASHDKDAPSSATEEDS